MMKILISILALALPAFAQFTNAKSIWSRPIISSAPSDGNALVWNASQGKYIWSTVALSGISGLGTGVATFLGTPSSANLASAVTDETGSGALVFATSPAIANITPGADFTLTQNSVTALTSVNSGAVANTLYLSAGKVGISGCTGLGTVNLTIGASGCAETMTIAVGGGSTIIDTVSSTIMLKGGGNLKLNLGSTIAYSANLTSSSGGTVLVASGGAIGVKATPANNYALDVSGSTASATARFWDQTASTGATLVTLTIGAAQTTSSTVLDIGGVAKFSGSNSTAAVAGVIGNTCPAVTCTAAYTWVKAVSSDGSTVYFPVWK